jgi:hypothetical protein
LRARLSGNGRRALRHLELKLRERGEWEGGDRDVEARRDVMRRRGWVWLARGEEGPGWDTDPGVTDVGDAVHENRGVAETDTWAVVGEAARPAAMGSVQ